MQVICTYCGKTFNRNPAAIGKRTFCCRDCFTKFSQENGALNPNYKGGKILVSCTQCFKGIYKDLYNSKGNHFCSRECFGKWTSLNKVGENAVGYKSALHVKSCIICGSEFTTYSVTQIYCSIDCKAKSQLKKKQIMLCTNCDKEYEVTPSVVYWSNKRGCINNFCSKECQYTYLQKENHPHWITDRTQLKDHNKSIRWSKQMVDWRKSVYIRDNYTCQMCGNRSTKNSGIVLNAHHIIKFSDNKDLRFDIANGVTLCEHCHKLTYGKEYEFEEQFKNKIK